MSTIGRILKRYIHSTAEANNSTMLVPNPPTQIGDIVNYHDPRKNYESFNPTSQTRTIDWLHNLGAHGPNTKRNYKGNHYIVFVADNLSYYRCVHNARDRKWSTLSFKP